ncbi:uncharacterized protein [Coffea arabica]|uniref:RNase H type-1 domain-containing protein n=1 Tax=Coffea arabica TaxID=13443 RepID=A0ABM4U5S2_COFAR
MAVQRAEELVDQDYSKECQIELNKAQAELRHSLSIEEQYWRQKARVKWLRHGDSNTRYFHVVVRQRRAQGMIHRIKKSNGVWVEKDDDIASEATAYFNDLFTGPLESSIDMLHLIPPLVTEEDNGKLEALPSIEEVYGVIKLMDGESVAGPDGFTGKFFTFAWEVIAQDVYNAVLSFFCGAELPRFITSTSIVLIPKTPNPQEFSQFRPISTGFVKGRNITENFLLAQEMVSSMGKRNRDGNVLMKLDMSKAYDRVSWGHIISVLRRIIIVGIVHESKVLRKPSSLSGRTQNKVFGSLEKDGQFIPNLTFRNFIINGHWDVNLLHSMMPREKLISILEHSLPEEGSEVEVFWMPTTSSKFSLQSAFGDIRQTRHKSMAFTSIWHPRIPWKVSFFMLRLFLGRLPLADRLGKLGFQLSSKCFCCSSASVESIEHLFANGQIASTVWNYFGGLCGFSCPGSFLRSRIVGWWFRLHDSETRRLIDRILPSVLCWHIWKARNKAMFEGVQMQSSAICKDIFSEIQSMVGIHFKQALQLQSFCHLYDRLNVSVGRTAYKLVRWETKETRRFILNADGCSKGNPGVGGGRGVLRDSIGVPVFTFSAYLGQTTSLRAETWALLIGLQTCKHRGFENISVQSDSLLLVGIIQQRIPCPWEIRREVRQIWKLLEDPVHLSHCYREANTVADALSNVGTSHPHQQVKVYDIFSMFPREARRAIRLDKLGLPSVREIRRL